MEIADAYIDDGRQLRPGRNCLRAAEYRLLPVSSGGGAFCLRGNDVPALSSMESSERICRPLLSSRNSRWCISAANSELYSRTTQLPETRSVLWQLRRRRFSDGVFFGASGPDCLRHSAARTRSYRLRSKAPLARSFCPLDKGPGSGRCDSAGYVEKSCGHSRSPKTRDLRLHSCGQIIRSIRRFREQHLPQGYPQPDNCCDLRLGEYGIRRFG